MLIKPIIMFEFVGGKMKRPTALGIYIFAGGFTLGVKKYFKVLAHFDMGYGANVMRVNQPDIPLYLDEKYWPIEQFKSKVDFIYGNPPCAPWSLAGRQAWNAKQRPSHDKNWWQIDPRVQWVRRQFNLLVQIKPKIWVWESVPQAFKNGYPLIQELTQKALNLGYSVSYVHYNAMYLGSYQNRKRFFMVAHKVRIPWSLPKFKSPLTSTQALALYDKTGDHGFLQLSNVPPTFLKRAKPGSLRTAQKLCEAWCSHRFPFMAKKLAKDQPACGITSCFLVHPTLDRFLTIGELLFLAGFPTSYKLFGSIYSKGSLIGRGVAPPVGAWLAKQVYSGIKRNQATSDTVTNIDILKPPGKITIL